MLSECSTLGYLEANSILEVELARVFVVKKENTNRRSKEKNLEKPRLFAFAACLYFLFFISCISVLKVGRERRFSYTKRSRR